ncbi:helix-turn-helix transcriptional regulator [Lipingzhangella sp. LS1_29]|uniref:Helix-turn-helix transcriptional regulator n=1 Tax=Lipingzhangella rawalii TaxID=2055835 RepID=A0ABU2H5V7_9ACTN|nr:helix-turn-helix transcriptional regulator [Lipingzhangella rawalii]MDS1270683.1 helix-turn-helix transcriptional regulator [Lipingzhangella rawalii]
MELREACRAAGIGVVVTSDHVGPPRLHRAVPALYARLVISLGAPIEVRYDGHVHHMPAVVAGLMRPGIATPTLTLRSNQPTVYVELSPLTLHRLTGVPPSAVDAGGIDADVLLPWVGWARAELATHPVQQRAWLMRVRLLEQLERANRIAASHDALASLRFIASSGGRVSVTELARHAHLSPRHLRHVMRHELGIGPKFAARVARLGTAVRRASEGADSWAQVAADSGYSDQSHLVREFTELMRTTPSGWLAEESRNLQGWRQPAP